METQTPTTGINLEKGQKVDLTKTNPTVAEFSVGLGWNPNSAVGGEFDLDATAFVVGEDGKRLSDKHMVFYNNLTAPGVTHTGDNRTGEGDGDDESIVVNFSQVDPTAKAIHFVATIHEAAARNQNFGQVNGAYIRVCNKATGEEIMKFDLNEDYSVETAMEFGKLYQKDGEWKFEAVGSGMKGGLADYVNKF